MGYSTSVTCLRHKIESQRSKVEGRNSNNQKQHFDQDVYTDMTNGLNLQNHV